MQGRGPSALWGRHEMRKAAQSLRDLRGWMYQCTALYPPGLVSYCQHLKVLVKQRHRACDWTTIAELKGQCRWEYYVLYVCLDERPDKRKEKKAKKKRHKEN